MGGNPRDERSAPSIVQAVTPPGSRRRRGDAAVRPTIAETCWASDPPSRVVGGAGGGAAAPGPVRVEELAARLVEALVGVRAEVVALRLQQVRREPAAAVPVVV